MSFPNTAVFVATAVAIMNRRRHRDEDGPVFSAVEHDHTMEMCPLCYGEGTNEDETDNCTLCEGFGEVPFDVAREWYDEHPDSFPEASDPFADDDDDEDEE